MKNYETLFITNSQLTEDEQTAMVEKYTSVIENTKGKVVNVDKWGKRVLAYPIENETDGFYTLINFEGTGETVNELDRKMKIEEKVMRHIVVSLEHDQRLMAKQEAKKAKKASKQKKVQKENVETNTAEQGE